MPKPSSAEALRAATLSRVPGMTIAEAATRFKVTKAAVAAARKEITRLSLAEIALAAITDNGTTKRGELTAKTLQHVAGWLDYINHDSCNSEDVRNLLAGWVKDGTLAIDGDRWTLKKPWP